MRKTTLIFAFLFAIAARGQNQQYKAKVFKDGVEVGEIAIPVIGSTGGTGGDLWSDSVDSDIIPDGNLTRSIGVAGGDLFQAIRASSFYTGNSNGASNSLTQAGLAFYATSLLEFKSPTRTADSFPSNLQNVFYFNQDGNIMFNKGGQGTTQGAILIQNNTGIRQYTLPDKNGTVAMLDDISGGGNLTTDQTNTIANSVLPPKTLLKNDDFTLVANDMRMQTSGNADLGRSYVMTVNDGGTTVATIADVGAVDDVGRIRTVSASDTFEAIPDAGVTLDWKTKTGTENAVRVNGKGHIAYFQKTAPNNYFFYGDITGYTYVPPPTGTELYPSDVLSNPEGTGISGNWFGFNARADYVESTANPSNGTSHMRANLNNATQPQYVSYRFSATAGDEITWTVDAMAATGSSAYISIGGGFNTTPSLPINVGSYTTLTLSSTVATTGTCEVRVYIQGSTNVDIDNMSLLKTN